MFNKPGVSAIVLGMFVLFLGGLMWDFTHNWYAYWALHVPAGAMILWGTYRAFTEN